MKELIIFAIFCSVLSFSTKTVYGNYSQTNKEKEIDHYLNIGSTFLSDNITDSAIIYLEKALKLSYSNNLPEKEFEIHLKICEYYSYLNKFINAQDELEKSKIIYKKLEIKPILKSKYFKTIGYLAFCKHDYINSEIAYNKALKFCKNNDTQITLFQLKNCIKQFKIKKANEYVISIINLPEKEWIKFSKEINFTIIEYAFLSNNTNDIDYYLNKVLIELEQKNKFSNNVARAYHYYCLGLIYYQLEEYTKALRYLKLAINNYSIPNKTRNYKEIISIYSSIAGIYSRINDFSSAELYLDLTFSLDNKIHVINSFEKEQLFVTYGINSYYKRDYKESIEYLDSAAKYIKNGNNDIKANLYDYYGLVYSAIGQYDKSQYHYKKAIDFRLKEIPINILCLSKDYQNYSELLSKMGKSKEAIEMGKKSCSLIKQVMDEKTSSVSLANSSLAKIYSDNKEYNLAILTYDKAILSACAETTLNKNKLSPESEKIIYPLAYLRAIKGKASAFNTMANNSPNKTTIYQNSLTLYTEAIDVLEKIKGNYQFDNDKLQLTENENSLYNEAIQVAYELYEITRKEEYINIAFNFSERNKAGILHEKISVLAIASEGTLQYKLFTQDQDLRKIISILEHKIASSESKNKNLTSWKEQLYSLYNKQEDFFSMLKLNYPVYYESWCSPQFISISDLQKNISDKESVVEYILNENTLYTIVISKKSKQFIRTDIPDNFKSNFQQYLQNVSSAGSDATTLSGFNTFIKKSNYLYSLLINPIKNNVQNNSLIIVPDGMLNLLPFETLVTNANTFSKVDYRNLSYLIFENPISYTNSATLYCNPSKAGKQNDNKILAFASGYTSTEHGNQENNTRSSLTLLRGAQDEVNSFNNVIRGDYYLSENASESEFKKLASGYSILHLAMHGEANQDDPEKSRLIFENGGESNDGYLYAWEIYNMQLNPSLVVLSACNTGTGMLRKGEGVMSLARSFMCAGCPSVVMTLWSISDLSSTNLMKKFYINLSDGDNKAEALQQAKVQYISQTGPMNSHPYYWAGYVVLGNKSPVVIETPTNQMVYASTASLAVLLFALIFIRRKNLKANKNK